MLLKDRILNVVGSKQLNNKFKTTPKISFRTRQAAAATPKTPANEENSEELLEKNCKRRIRRSQGKSKWDY